MDEKQILLINDMAGYGKVATAAMLPILSYFGFPTYNLPTALVSNTLDYGKFNILETTDYIQGVFPVWKELGFTFDAIATGFIASERQAGIISNYCKEQSAGGTVIFVDPIMGDEGRLYNGVTPATIQSMREMAAVAHLIFLITQRLAILQIRLIVLKGCRWQKERRSLINFVRWEAHRL